MEKTIIILKPDCFERQLVGKVFERIEELKVNFLHIKFIQPSINMLRLHYPDSMALEVAKTCVDAGCTFEMELEEYGKEVLKWNRQYMMRNKLLVMLIKGDNIINDVRKIVGATNPKFAEKGTIRGDFGIDNIIDANNEKRGTENLIHACRDVNEFNAELPIWFPELTIHVK